MADVKIFGKKVSPWVAGAIGVGSLGVIWFAWKQHEASQGTSASASSIDPVTGLPYSQDNQDDPLTGQTYLAEAEEYGSVAAAENAVAGESSLDYSTAYGTGSGGVVGTSTGTGLVPANEVQAATYASNAAWAQAAEAGLTDLGYSSTDIAAALGRYLGNLSETSDQATIVQAAIAEYGPPPVGSYQIIMASSTTTAGSGSTSTGTTTGSTSSSSSSATSTVSGGRVTSVTNNTAVIAWDHAGPATSWRLTITGPGAINGHVSTATIPQGTYSGLEAGHTYEVEIQPLPSGQPGEITIKTT